LLSEGHARNIDDFAREINQYHLRIRRKPKHENYSLEHIVTNLFRRLKPQTTRSQIVKQLQVTEAELERLQKKPYPFLKLVNHSIDIKKWISRCKEHLAN
jgi:hypothetical protein